MTMSRRAACSLQDFNLVEVFSGLSLISEIHPQFISSSVAGISSADLAAVSQTRSCEIITVPAPQPVSLL